MKLGLLLPFMMIASPSYAMTSVELGKQIYETGIGSNGKSIIGERNGELVEGGVGACANCHKSSGMGGKEGQILIAPISAQALFQPSGEKPYIIDHRYPSAIVKKSKPYTDASLATAIATGQKANGSSASELMPRFNLEKSDMDALVLYLHELSGKNDPGVDEKTVKFGIIFTPDVRKEDKKIALDMINTFFLYRNSSWHEGGRHMRMGMELIPRIEREWKLVEWQLSGPEDTWKSQLKNFNDKEPVFSLISGISNTTWKPIHEYCQETKIPCLFPSTEGIVQSEDKYQFYFSKGSILEAEILANYLSDKKIKRVVQVYGTNDIIIKTLTDKLTSVQIINIKVDDLNQIKIKSDDVIVLWLNEQELDKAQKMLKNVINNETYISTFTSGNGLLKLPKEWKNKVKIIYPFESGKVLERQEYPLRTWLTTYNIPLQNEKLQSEIFFNLFMLSQVTGQILDNYFRDYFIELVESTLSAGTNRTVYPWVSLGPKQRFISKGGYIAKFDKNGTIKTISQKIVN